MMQSLASDYFYTQPLNFGRICVYPIYNYHNCPTYAPIVKDGICRMCNLNSNNHRKYYIYSNYARKIQKAYFEYKFKKLYKECFKNIKMFNFSSRPFFVLILLYKKKYYRQWNKFNMEQFFKNYK